MGRGSRRHRVGSWPGLAMRAGCRRDSLEGQAQQPLRLPSVDEIAALAYQLDARLSQDPQAGRAQLLRWLKDGKLRVVRGDDGKHYARGEILPLTLLADAENENTAQQRGGDSGSVYDLRSGGRI